jgi:hypothetical protein
MNLTNIIKLFSPSQFVCNAGVLRVPMQDGNTVYVVNPLAALAFSSRAAGRSGLSEGKGTLRLIRKNSDMDSRLLRAAKGMTRFDAAPQYQRQMQIQEGGNGAGLPHRPGPCIYCQRTGYVTDCQCVDRPAAESTSFCLICGGRRTVAATARTKPEQARPCGHCHHTGAAPWRVVANGVNLLEFHADLLYRIKARFVAGSTDRFRFVALSDEGFHVFGAVKGCDANLRLRQSIFEVAA